MTTAIEKIQRDALDRALHGNSMSNYVSIISEFSSRGIPVEDIKPRENVFTYHAWRALGRQVRRGESGVRIVTFRTVERKVTRDDGTVEVKQYSRPWSAYVFHVSQTDPIS